MTALRTRLVPLEKLMPDPANARKHDDRNLDAIRRSLSRFGQRKPIVCARSNDGQLIVIAGNGTLEAARSLGWTEITIVDVPSEWDADTARAYAIADNRTAELADWDQVQLSSALVDLDAIGWDIADLGFTPLQPPSGDAADAFASLPDGDRPDATQMTFTVTLRQGEIIKSALERAKHLHSFEDSENRNSNGNALAAIAEEWMSHVG